MRAIVLIALLAVLAVCFAALPAPRERGQRGQWRNFKPRGPRPQKGQWRNKAKRVQKAEEESDSEFIGFLAPIAFNLIKNKLSKRDDFEEEADAEFLGKALKKVGKVALGVGKMYLRTQGIPLDDEESDSMFFGKLKSWWQNKGESIFQKGLQIYSAIKGNQAAPTAGDDTEEADAEFFKNLLKKVGGIALQAGKAYVGSKYGIQLDDEESDFINWKKIGSIAKDIGKTYLSSKYGINLDEAEEESDSEFLGKINWGKIGNIAKDIGKTYLSSKYGINLDEAEEESDFINWKKIGSIAKDIGKTYLSSKYGINLDEEVDAEEEADQTRNFNFGANVAPGAWNVNGGLTGTTRGGANYNVGATYGAGNQWGVNAGYDRSWNNGNTNFGATVGHGSGGFNAGVKFTHRF